VTACPWPKPQIKIMVRRALDTVGGPRGFTFVGPEIQRAIIAKACWDAIRTASSINQIEIDAATMWAIESAFLAAAGIVDSD